MDAIVDVPVDHVSAAPDDVGIISAQKPGVIDSCRVGARATGS